MEDERLNHWIIYMYTFPNGKRYIGKTKRSLSRRQGADFSGYKNCPVLWNAIQKYGIDNIEQEILVDEYLDDASASELEQEYILMHRTNCNQYSNPSYGYNLTDGGEGLTGWHPDEKRYAELCEMMHTFHEQRRGTHHSEAARQKMREAKLGTRRGPMSEETKRKISIANSRENMSPETAKRRSEARKKKIVAVSKDTGERLVFDSVHDTASYFGVRDSSISRWCEKTRNPTNNYEFNYLFANND